MIRTENKFDDREAFVHRMVSDQAANWPDALAISSTQGSLTYAELDSRANRLARCLQDMGVTQESVVGLWLTRSPWLIVSALAVLKAGGAYLPLDPSNPVDRLHFMLSDSGAKVVVTEAAMAEATRGTSCPALFVDLLPESDESEPHVVELHPEALAYVIYTSGSTGEPKGVEITHANLASLVAWHNRAFSIDSADRASHLAGLGFDASVWETWPYLAAGASIHLADFDNRISPEQLLSWMVAKAITIGFVPTPLAERMLLMSWPQETELRTLLTGGDTLRVRPSPALPFAVVNNYGPTECTVVSTSTVVLPSSEKTDLPPIGVPVDNAEVYILDQDLRPVTEGECGELYVAGKIVGRGYRNRADLTAERFIPNPFAPGIMYRTGDLGRNLRDGQIAFLGRIDDQIKIRGCRIELNEIAITLNAIPALSTAVVTAYAEPGEEKRLVAYIVAQENLTRADLQDFLLARLPDYMIPATFVPLESIPLTANGKVDYAALPAPTAENTLIDQSLEPLSELEAAVAGIVAELLHISEVAPDDDFFLLGGHSLLGTQLIARLRDGFDVDVRLRTLFEQPTVRALSAEIERLLLEKIEAMSEDDAQRALDTNAPLSWQSTSSSPQAQLDPSAIGSAE
jgi:amino acid adenylation domain-containing protein